jgi:hypothetical protein
MNGIKNKIGKNKNKIDSQSDVGKKITRVEAGSNTSTVTLRVVRGDEMGLKKPRHSLSG